MHWPALCLVLLVVAPGLYPKQSLAAIAGLLKWCAMLAVWGLVPLVMWR